MPPAPHPTTPARRPSLEPGQVLARSLVDPVRGHALLATGAVLTPAIISKIRRLGLVEETLGCIDPSATAEPPKSPPACQEAETSLYEGLDQLFTPPTREEPFQEAWSLVKGLIHRVRELEPVHRRDFRIQGGGAMVHPLNVMLLALQLGAAMRLPQANLLSLAQASLLHDIGKRRLGKEHYKRSALNSYERRLLERHVEYGLDLIDRYRDQFPPLSEAARSVIYAHHERWDGSGYPRGLKGERIPLLARIIAIADSYDAMLSDHVYRRRMLPEEAYLEIGAQAGKAYDPAIAQVFKRVIAPYPVSSLVRLETGEVARVVALGDDHCRPIVRMSGVATPVDLGHAGTPHIVRALYPRRFPRFPRVSPASLRVPDEHGAFPGCTLNLSLGGACVALDASLEAGTMLTLELGMPGAPRLELPSLVVWSATARRKTCLGLSFHPMPDRAWMQAYCRV